MITAALLSDGAQFGYLSQLFTVNGAPQMRTMYLQKTDGVISPGRLSAWVAGDPQYQMVEHSPPIRFEAIGPGSLVGMWESYAVLRRDDRPVDFAYYPEGSHSLVMPRQRLASQGGSIDWFRFWLQDHEDSGEEKAQLYARWRQFKSKNSAKH